MSAAIELFPVMNPFRRAQLNTDTIMAVADAVIMKVKGVEAITFDAYKERPKVLNWLGMNPTATAWRGGELLAGFILPPAPAAAPVTTPTPAPAAAEVPAEVAPAVEQKPEAERAPKPVPVEASAEPEAEAKAEPVAAETVMVEAPAAPKVEEKSKADAKPSEGDNDNHEDGGDADGDATNGSSEPIEENLSLIEARVRAAKQRHAVLQEFNERYSVVNAAGTAMIFSDEYDPALERKVYRYMKPGDLKLLYLNRSVCTQVDAKDNGKPDPKYGKVADFWLKHKERRQYVDGVVFDPSERSNSLDVLNLWRGFSVQPVQGSWEKLKSHIRTNICCGNKVHFDYMMGWMARLIQYPGKRGEVAVVLRGGLGVGKGIVVNALCALFHQHALHISLSKHLVGNFNLHLRDCVLLFSDEAFFAGDKKGVGALKSLITEPYLTIEPKFQNVSQSPNYLHIIMASNESWVIPAAIDERRFFVLDVSSEHKQDKPYFAAITKELESGGYEAMLYDLMHYDLSEFEVRNVPETKALQDQKKRSLENKHGWWREVLSRGYVFRSKLGLEDYFAEWHEFVATSLLYDSYRDFSKEAGERHPLSREELGRFIRELGCKPAKPGETVIGEHLTPGGAALIQKRKPGYQLGSLDEARDAFERITGLAIEWEDPD